MSAARDEHEREHVDVPATRDEPRDLSDDDAVRIIVGTGSHVPVIFGTGSSNSVEGT